MELEKQVCSLELSKKLKELRMKQESLFGWFYNDGMGEWELDQYQDDWPKGKDIKQYSTFTVAELGEMLPDKVCQYWEGGQINTLYDDPEHKKGFVGNEADARAKMLIYLLENNLINLPTNE